MDTYKKGFVNIILMVALIIIVAGVFGYLAFIQKQSTDVISIQSKTNKESKTLYQTLRNDMRGVILQIPADWEVSGEAIGSQNDASFLMKSRDFSSSDYGKRTQGAAFSFEDPENIVDVLRITKSVSLDDYYQNYLKKICDEDCKSSIITLGGEKAMLFEYPNNNNVNIFTVHNEIVYAITFAAMLTQENRNILSKFISGFEFIQ